MLTRIVGSSNKKLVAVVIKHLRRDCCAISAPKMRQQHRFYVFMFRFRLGVLQPSCHNWQCACRGVLPTLLSNKGILMRRWIAATALCYALGLPALAQRPASDSGTSL